MPSGTVVALALGGCGGTTTCVALPVLLVQRWRKQKDRVAYTDTNGHAILFSRNRAGKVDFFANGTLRVSDLSLLEVGGCQIYLDGTSGGSWESACSISVPHGQEHTLKLVSKLFRNKDLSVAELLYVAEVEAEAAAKASALAKAETDAAADVEANAKAEDVATPYLVEVEAEAAAKVGALAKADSDATADVEAIAKAEDVATPYLVKVEVEAAAKAATAEAEAAAKADAEAKASANTGAQQKDAELWEGAEAVLPPDTASVRFCEEVSTSEPASSPQESLLDLTVRSDVVEASPAAAVSDTTMADVNGGVSSERQSPPSQVVVVRPELFRISTSEQLSPKAVSAEAAPEMATTLPFISGGLESGAGLDSDGLRKPQVRFCAESPAAAVSERHGLRKLSERLSFLHLEASASVTHEHAEATSTISAEKVTLGVAADRRPCGTEQHAPMPAVSSPLRKMAMNFTASQVDFVPLEPDSTLQRGLGNQPDYSNGRLSPVFNSETPGLAALGLALGNQPDYSDGRLSSVSDSGTPGPAGLGLDIAFPLKEGSHVPPPTFQPSPVQRGPAGNLGQASHSPPRVAPRPSDDVMRGQTTFIEDEEVSSWGWFSCAPCRPVAPSVSDMPWSMNPCEPFNVDRPAAPEAPAMPASSRQRW